MLSMMLFLLVASGAMSPQDAPRPARSATATASGQSVNGGVPQRVDTSTPRSTAREEHVSDGMNTKRAPDPRKRDEYGASKVTPPVGQGTDNPGGIPGKRQHPPHPRAGEDQEN